MNRAAIILAAGAGSRFGGDKLSALFNGEALITHAIRTALAAPVDHVIVVCTPSLNIPGHPKVRAIRLSSPELSASLKAGIAALQDADAAFIFLGDMPLIPHNTAHELAAELRGNIAALPRFAGKPGHPVLLSARAFPLVASLTGDEGAGRLLKARKDVAFIDVADEGVIQDIDRVEDITRLETF